MVDVHARRLHRARIGARRRWARASPPAYAQLAVDVFGVPIERIRVLQGDTDRVNGFGSAGSRSLFIGGSAVQVASDADGRQAQAARRRARWRRRPPTSNTAPGRFGVPAPTSASACSSWPAGSPTRASTSTRPAPPRGPSWPNGCHVCEVEIDPATGAVEVVAYASVNDIGRVVSPMHRARADRRRRGAGHRPGAVRAHGRTTRDSGQAADARASWTTRCRASTASAASRRAFDTSVPCLTNPLGVKGVGELGTIGATPAVVNAVVDALDHAGLGRDAERVQMPLTRRARVARAARAIRSCAAGGPLAGWLARCGSSARRCRSGPGRPAHRRAG